MESLFFSPARCIFPCKSQIIGFSMQKYIKIFRQPNVCFPVVHWCPYKCFWIIFLFVYVVKINYSESIGEKYSENKFIINLPAVETYILVRLVILLCSHHHCPCPLEFSVKLKLHIRSSVTLCDFSDLRNYLTLCMTLITSSSSCEWNHNSICLFVVSRFHFA